MRSAIILALTSSTLAMPFGNVIDTIFGTSYEARHVPAPDQIPAFHAIGTVSGTGFIFPTATGASPTGRPHGTGSRPGHGHKTKTKTKSKTKSLAIDYELAPTAVPNIGDVKRQAGSGSSLPSFTLLDPSDAVPGVPKPTGTKSSARPRPTKGPGSRVPSSTAKSSLPSPTEAPGSPTPTEDPESSIPFPTPTDEPSLPSPTDDPESPFPTEEPPFPTATGQPEFPFPTGDFPIPTGGFPIPTGGFPFPTGGFPGSRIPGRPTTLKTLTRGPRPTAVPEQTGLPGGDEDGETGTGDAQGFLEWLQGMFGGAKGN
ncbi:uncharacterized protein K460DRAFT_144237 [Cucurbitaria berberidis CBS 394.84]|uniref:Uncharacterized protein n=1 Tax=Cucurbitaria berberidis CBS 394.84 TaxID=1168544 RepID=A0A9P4GD06_9PLEO|nr:uncharacterized protein K460DRAFT_144237 [Cucurbitaria berberidis CBS 394.84]KAF1843377.1 hypothetical protein K460DRAFT_144237 [Cucurbitaria berberidis CBS 394.84]